MLDESRTPTVEINRELLEALVEATREGHEEERFASMATPLMTGG
jgi:hypothetical protein